MPRKHDPDAPLTPTQKARAERHANLVGVLVNRHRPEDVAHDFAVDTLLALVRLFDPARVSNGEEGFGPYAVHWGRLRMHEQMARWARQQEGKGAAPGGLTGACELRALPAREDRTEEVGRAYREACRCLRRVRHRPSAGLLWRYYGEGDRAGGARLYHRLQAALRQARGGGAAALSRGPWRKGGAPCPGGR